MKHASAPVIRARQLVRRFGAGAAAFAAVRDISLTVHAGEVVLLFGPSGSGKSTLLGLLGGLDRAYSGALELFGQDLARLSDRELSELRGARIGFVFQSFHLLEHLSVLDNVLAPALFAGAAELDLRSRAAEVLTRVGLLERAADRPSQLSGGQRQRVAIARALLRRPSLMLCDEPTGNLDRQTGESIIDLFGELHAELGTTFVIVTHEERLRRLGSRVLYLEDGELVREEAGLGAGVSHTAPPAGASPLAAEAPRSAAQASALTAASAPPQAAQGYPSSPQGSDASDEAWPRVAHAEDTE